MANILEYTLSLKDRVSGKLTKIAIANDGMLASWGRAERKAADAASTMEQCGVTVGSLRQRIAALNAEKELIPLDNIDMLRTYNREIESLTKQVEDADATKGNALETWFDGLGKAARSAFAELAGPAALLQNTLSGIRNFAAGAQDAWNAQTQAEASLAGAMRRRMGASMSRTMPVISSSEAPTRRSPASCGSWRPSSRWVW